MRSSVLEGIAPKYELGPGFACGGGRMGTECDIYNTVEEDFFPWKVTVF